MEKSWREAIKKVLLESSTPLHYAEISEQILSRGYYSSDGATPAATVNAQISASIKHDGDKSPFVRTNKGVFTLKSSEKPVSPATIDIQYDGLIQLSVPLVCIGSVI